MHGDLPRMHSLLQPPACPATSPNAAAYTATTGLAPPVCSATPPAAAGPSSATSTDSDSDTDIEADTDTPSTSGVDISVPVTATSQPKPAVDKRQQQRSSRRRLWPRSLPDTMDQAGRLNPLVETRTGPVPRQLVAAASGWLPYLRHHVPEGRMAEHCMGLARVGGCSCG